MRLITFDILVTDQAARMVDDLIKGAPLNGPATLNDLADRLKRHDPAITVRPSEHRDGDFGLEVWPGLEAIVIERQTVWLDTAAERRERAATELEAGRSVRYTTRPGDV